MCVAGVGGDRFSPRYNQVARRRASAHTPQSHTIHTRKKKSISRKISWMCIFITSAVDRVLFWQWSNRWSDFFLHLLRSHGSLFDLYSRRVFSSHTIVSCHFVAACLLISVECECLIALHATHQLYTHAPTEQRSVCWHRRITEEKNM